MPPKAEIWNPLVALLNRFIRVSTALNVSKFAKNMLKIPEKYPDSRETIILTPPYLVVNS